jgi:DNA-binding transcriptional MerR regulator
MWQKACGIDDPLGAPPSSSALSNNHADEDCGAPKTLDLESTRSISIRIVTNQFISIGELARLSGLSTHTLRFYEAAGVLKPVGRAANGHRRYQTNDVLWLEFVLKLKITGMPLAEIKRYAQLREQGEKTMTPRMAMLKLHRRHLIAKMDELAKCASALDDKIEIYRKMIAKAKAKKKR